jgi:hypothetical protein
MDTIELDISQDFGTVVLTIKRSIMKVQTLESIAKKVGTRFRFEGDSLRGVEAEYMILPQEGDDYWKTNLIDISPESRTVGAIHTFKSDDEIMQAHIIISLIP